MEFQIILSNFSGIRGVFHYLFNIKDDYLPLRCFMLSVPFEPIFEKKTKTIVLKMPKLRSYIFISDQKVKTKRNRNRNSIFFSFPWESQGSHIG